MAVSLHITWRPGAPAEEAEPVRIAMTAWMVLALLLISLGAGWASDKDEATATVRVTSADHELQEGYFSLGDSTTIMAKPGSDLHRFLVRQRGKKIRIVMSEAEGRELSQIRR
jgi:hypothetical protein